MHYRFLGFGMALLCTLSACQVKKATTTVEQRFIQHEGLHYQLNVEADLSALITVLAKDEGIWLENVSCQEIQLESGDNFLAVTADYLAEDKTTALLIPLRPAEKEGGQHFNVSCMMACATYLSCQEGYFEVIQPCREINCGCENGDGGGSSSVMFY
ncbi:MAG: hypothetical protein KTR30_26495 [Saprospiraceae bacterium]|nr:hypothetical protein [Saprospiraceae bacterium]